MISNSCALSIKKLICKHSHTLASSSGFSPCGFSIMYLSLPFVMESPVAKRVTSIPFSTNPSVMLEATCSHGPYFLGGVLHTTGDNIATLIFKDI